VHGEAEERGIPVNVADDPSHCTFYMPATVHRHPITIAISTEGMSPALARHLRERIEDAVPVAYAHLARLLGRLRAELLAAVPDQGERRKRLQGVIESDVMSLLHSGRLDDAERLARCLLGLGA
jgi:siroheme synthase-like protein